MNTKTDLQLYTIKNEKLEINIANVGASIINLFVKDKNNNKIDIALGHLDLEHYLKNSGNLGCVVGRNANRIKDAQVVINNKYYHLDKNDNNNNLHTNTNALQYQIFDLKNINEESITLSTLIPHLSDGFPGDLNLDVNYSLFNDTLTITYNAYSSEDTIVNITNHSYFNLNGQDESNIYDHTLFVNSNFYMPNDQESLPTKEILKVNNTPFDFREESNLKKHLLNDDLQIKMLNGIDNNFLLNCCDDDLAASLYSDKYKLRLNVYTDMPALHIYSANHFPDNNTVNKNNLVYPLHGGIAFESQFSPNTPNTPWLKSSLLKANERFKSTTKFQIIAY